MIDGLFKYFPPESYKLSRLVNHQVLLTPPKYFNDPWDFRVERVPITDAEIAAEFEKFEKERAISQAGTIGLSVLTSFEQHEKEQRFQRFKASVTAPDYREKEGSDMQRQLSEIFGVVSLTHDPINRLMWAHYADAHRGFVVQFAHTHEAERNGFRTLVSPFGLALKVVYQPELPKLEPDFKNAAKVYCTKHSKWKYEEEWRVIGMLGHASTECQNGKTFYLLNFRPNDLVRVIFGLRVSSTAKDQLLDMLRKEEFAHVQKEIIKIDTSSGELVLAPFLGN